MKKILLMMVCLGLLVGCKSSVVTPDGTEVSYRRGEGVMRAVLGGSMPQVTDATLATLEDLDFEIVDYLIVIDDDAIELATLLSRYLGPDHVGPGGEPVGLDAHIDELTLLVENRHDRRLDLLLGRAE